jgi:glutamyl-tRNA synthetase
MSKQTIRTRVAPSPTGSPHLGTAYIALFNMCFARQHQGQFILRIEDTDQVRSTIESEQAIFAALKWTGLQWDEGPDVGGDFGPYRQSERTAIYQEHVQILLDKGHAFHCFCSSELLDAVRKEQMAKKERPCYNGCCLSLSDEEVKKRLAAGESYVIRMKIPDQGECEFDDMLRGKITIDWSQIDMQVLMKTDGMPTYHLANVVDDHLMQITHVIRGEEWINSAPKHQLLYQYFDWQMPELCHMPLLRNPDKSKLSKRKNPTGINYYKRAGYLPEALLNYLGRMGWSMPDESEKFSVETMISNFDIQRVTLGGPTFDLEKLSWLNGTWLREEINDSDFQARYQAWLSEGVDFKKLIPHVKERVNIFGDVVGLASYFIEDRLNLNEHSFEKNKLEIEDQKKVLQFSLWAVEGLADWSRSAIENELFSMADKLDIKIRDFVAPLFVALSGKTTAVSVIDSIDILGIDMTRIRLRDAIEALGGVSKKGAKKLEKEYDSLSKLS